MKQSISIKTFNNLRLRLTFLIVCFFACILYIKTGFLLLNKQNKIKFSPYIYHRYLHSPIILLQKRRRLNINPSRTRSSVLGFNLVLTGKILN